MAYLLKSACCHCCKRRGSNDRPVRYRRNYQQDDIGIPNPGNKNTRRTKEPVDSVYTSADDDVRGPAFISPTPAHAEILTDYRPSLRKIVQPGFLWPYLRKYRVVDRETEDKIKLNATSQEQVERLLDHISTKPPWCFHAFLRSCSLADQRHVVNMLGYPSALYECQEDTVSKPWCSSRGQQSQCPGEANPSTSSSSEKDFSQRLMQVLALHNEYYRDNLMRGKLFDFKHDDPDADIYDIDICYMQQDAKFQQCRQTAHEIKLRDILRKYGDYSMPRTTLLFGPAGAGKSTFFRRFAYCCAQEYLKFMEDPEQHACPQPTLAIYVPARTMTSDIWASIMKQLRCKEEDKPFLMTEVRSGYLSTDNTSSIMLDAIDEVRDAKVLKAIQDFIQQKHQEGGPQILVSARTGLSRIDKSSFNRFLQLEGFTMKQGLEYTHRYITQHSQRKDLSKDKSSPDGKQEVQHEPAILSQIRNRQEKLRPILSNPLRAHLLSGLAVEGLVKLDDENVLQSIELLTTMEKFFITRETGGAGVPLGESKRFYQLCLFGLLEGLREFTDAHLQKFHVEDSAYLSFLRRDSKMDKSADHFIVYSFEHELLYEFFAARAIETLPMGTSNGILLYICSTDILHNLKKLIFGIVGEYGGHDSVPQLVVMTQLIVLLEALEKHVYLRRSPQYPVCQEWYIFEEAIHTLQQRISETLPEPGWLLAQMGNENALDDDAVHQIWEMVEGTFTQLTHLTKSNQSPYGPDYWAQKYLVLTGEYLQMGFLADIVADLIADCTLKQQAEVARNTFNRMVPCNGFYPCGGIRWLAIGDRMITCWSPVDLLEVLREYEKEVTDELTTERLEIDFRNTPSQWGTPPEEHWTPDVWDKVLTSLITYGCRALKFEFPHENSVPLHGLLYSTTHLDKSRYSLDRLNVYRGTISLADLHQCYQELGVPNNVKISLSDVTLQVPIDKLSRKQLLRLVKGKTFAHTIKQYIAEKGPTRGEPDTTRWSYPLIGGVEVVKPTLTFI